MNISIRPFFLFSFLFSFLAINAQNDVPDYTVQVGNFVNPKSGDFEQLSNMGFLYSVQRADSHTDVYIGGFTSDEAANKVVSRLKGQGYANAFVAKLNTENAPSETVIQLDTKTAGDKIDWTNYLKAGKLYVLLNGRQLKIMSGGYKDMTEAKASLPGIQALGFEDAFIKNANNALLHEVGEFETGGVSKKPLIPLDFTTKDKVLANENAKNKEKPSTYEEVVVIVPEDKKATGEAPVLTPKGIDDKKQPVEEAPIKKKTVSNEPAFDFRAKMPDIRAKVKRNSALELQKVLKEEGYYKSSLDGYYGKGTRNSYDMAAKANHQLQKYNILAKYMEIPAVESPAGALQGSINNLWQDPQAALDQLEKSKSPIAKAYRAYFFFATDGHGFEVNTLMNEALKEAGSKDSRATLPTFDPYATYDYRDIKQLLTHMRFVHETTRDDVQVPCWMFRRHPGTALKAFGEIDGIKSSLSMQTCGGFWEWQEIQVLNAIASDLCTDGHKSDGKIANSQAELAQLYLAPESMGWKERKELMDWNEKVWQGIDAWGTRDPLLKEIATALKISYYQNYVLLEDYYMDEGFDTKDAKGLALSTLKALVGHHFERFI